MDNPHVEVRSTPKYGNALFALKDLAQGEIVADWTGGKVYHSSKASKLPNDSPLFIQDHAIQFAEDKYIDTPGIGRNFAHSCEPNCGYSGKFKIVTMRPIKAGEELTFDYAMSEDSDWRMKCVCGSNRCRGIIGAFEILPESFREEYFEYLSDWIKEKYNLSR